MMSSMIERSASSINNQKEDCFKTRKNASLSPKTSGDSAMTRFFYNCPMFCPKRSYNYKIQEFPAKLWNTNFDPNQVKLFKEPV